MYNIVNVVLKARLCETKLPLDLTHLALKIFPTNSKLYKGRPTQLKITMTDENVICLIFGKGAIRLMGKGLVTANDDDDDMLSAYMTLFSITEKFTPEKPNLHIQTMTVVSNLPSAINLPNFVSKSTKFSKLKLHYDFELFSAVSVQNYAPIHVNIFASGKIVICGIKTTKQVDTIINDLLYAYYSITNTQ